MIKRNIIIVMDLLHIIFTYWTQDNQQGCGIYGDEHHWKWSLGMMMSTEFNDYDTHVEHDQTVMLQQHFRKVWTDMSHLRLVENGWKLRD